MKARVNTYLNMRTGTPEILPYNNPNDAYFKPGDVVEIVDTMIGEEYKGNDVWHRLDTSVMISNFGVDVDKGFFFKDNTPLSITNDLSKKIILNNPIGKNGRGVTIGILDSGIDVGHSALRSALKEEEKNFLSEKIPNTNSHGTKVAGLLVGNDPEITGLNIDSYIKSFRIIKNNQHVENTALKLALQEIVNNSMNEIDLLNLSFNIQTDSIESIQKFVDDLTKMGIIVIAAGGSFKSPSEMINLKNIITVGVFEESEFLEIRREGLPNKYSISFCNVSVLTTTLFNSESQHDTFINDSAYTAITTGIIGRFLSEKYIPKKARFEKVKQYLFDCSFNINKELSPAHLKPYRNETN